MRRSVRSFVLALGLGAVAFSGIAAGEESPVSRARPAEHRYTNRLIDSANPYLLLHAHNPVDWYPWGPEALARAKKEDKPIFLSVGYSSCYWCHVAEKRLYSDPAIAALMNQWFINIKVDREERPDVDRIYMLATHLLTGRGGWPNNVFLTPDMKPFFAGSYFPPTDDASGRPGFPTIMKTIHERWAADRQRVTDEATRVFLALQRAQRPDISRATVLVKPAEWLVRAREALARGFDPDNGGLSRRGTKFPHQPMLELLLTDYRINRAEESLRMLRKALDAMAYGGIRDHLAGGFHRYSTEPTWSVPHFEKMLYDNAQLLRLYAETYQITRDPLYRTVALELSDYLNGQMSAPQGGFYTAQDAEVNGEEGASYVWTRAEIVSILGVQDAQRFFQAYDLTIMARPAGQAGMGDPVGVLRVPAGLAKSRGNAALLESLNGLSALRTQLLDARNRRPQPLRDEKIIVGINGLAIEALVRSAQILGTPRDLAAARRAADRIWAIAYDPTSHRLRHQIFQGRAQTDAYLEDYALLGNGLMALYEATRDATARARAAALADDLLRRFGRPDGGLSTTPNEKDLLLPPQDDGDDVYPSGTSAAVALLLRVGTATSQGSYAAAAARVVVSLRDELQRSPAGWSALVATVNSRTPATQSLSAWTGPPAGPPGPSQGLTLPSTADHVRITATAATKDDHDEIVATLHIDEGWHVNANPASFDFLVPTTVTFSGPVPSGLAYPPSVRIKPRFAPDGLDVYEGQALVVATFPRGTLTQFRDIRATIRTQACSNEICLPEATFHATVPPGEAPR
jgi:hypothetical protein